MSSMASSPPSTSELSSVILPRIILCVVFCAGVFIPSLFQSALNTVYAHLLQSRIYRSSTFETFWTVFNYAIFETYYTVTFFRRPYLRLAVINSQHDPVNHHHPSDPDEDEEDDAAAAHGKQRPLKGRPQPPRRQLPKPPHGMSRIQHRLPEVVTYMAPLLLLDLTMIKKFADVPVSDMAASGDYDVPIGSGYFLNPTLHNFTVSSPVQTRRALPPAPPSSRRVVLELVVSLLIYDFLFFLFHLSLHRLPVAAIRRLHSRHHAHAEIHPQVTNRLDLAERMGLVLLANFSLNVIGAHVLTRTVFVTVFTYLLVEIHSGLALGWGYDRILPPGWAIGATRHARHHREGDGDFAPFFGWWDKVLEYIE